MKKLIIKIWGIPLGYISIEKGHYYADFKYNNNFMKTRIEVSPFLMKLDDESYHFSNVDYETFFGLPGLLRDSLPDRFGNLIIKELMSASGKDIKELTCLDRLRLISKHGMGALEFEPFIEFGKPLTGPIDIKRLLKNINDVLTKRPVIKTHEDLLTLAELCTFAGGMRPKATVLYNSETDTFRSSRNEVKLGEAHWLIKFDGVNLYHHNFMTPSNLSQIEYSYYLMAKEAGITMSDSQLYTIDGTHHFMTKRFDRVINEKGEVKKLHMQTLGALMHINHNKPGIFSYEETVEVMRKLNLLYSQIEEFFRRMVFNVITNNYDDHVKNISFLMDEEGVWSLSPAYDLILTYDEEYPSLNTHQMKINGKVKDITIDDLVESAKRMGITKEKALKVIAEVSNVIQRWPDFAKRAFLSEEELASLYSQLNVSFLNR